MLKLAIAPASSPLYGLVLWSPDPLDIITKKTTRQSRSGDSKASSSPLTATKSKSSAGNSPESSPTVSRKDVTPSPNLTKTHSTVADNLDDTRQVDVLETTTVITQTVSKLSELTHCPCAMFDRNCLGIKCSKCDKSWHTECCNLAGITQTIARKLEGRKWECPWCYQPAIPNPDYKDGKETIESLKAFMANISRVQACTEEVKEGVTAVEFFRQHIQHLLLDKDKFIAHSERNSELFDDVKIIKDEIKEMSSKRALYNNPGYESEYNSKITNKSKGSGLGIYINNDFQFTRIAKFCHCTENLESLFIEVTITDTPQVIGVIYRPPSVDVIKFYKESDDLLRELPNEHIHISGDYYIDLLTKGSEDFEQLIFNKKNLIPTISIATHERPGCKASLIDKIIINSTDKLLLSGVLKSRVSHHFLIFNIFECSSHSNANPEKRCPKYDFCETNVNKFVFETEISNHGPNYDYHEHNFNGFVSFLQGKINDNFLVDENKYSNSKRNRLFNPWITNGIIASVQRKTYFYDQWKKSCRDDNKLGDEELYMRYIKTFGLS